MMKKLLSFILLLLCFTGMTKADIQQLKIGTTAVSEITSGKTYVIAGAPQTGGTCYLYDNGSKVVGAATKPVFGDDVNKYVWTITASGDGYTIQDQATSQYISITSTSDGGAVNTVAASTVMYIDFDGTNAGIRNSSNQYIDVAWDGSAPTSWSGGVGGSRILQIYEAEIETVASVTYTVTVTGNEDGAVTYNGTAYTNGQTITATSLITTADLTAKEIEGYDTKVTVSGTSIKVVYAKHLNAGYFRISCNDGYDTYYLTASTATASGWGMDVTKTADGSTIMYWSIENTIKGLTANKYINEPTSLGTTGTAWTLETGTKDGTYAPKSANGNYINFEWAWWYGYAEAATSASANTDWTFEPVDDAIVCQAIADSYTAEYNTLLTKAGQVGYPTAEDLAPYKTAIDAFVAAGDPSKISTITDARATAVAKAVLPTEGYYRIKSSNNYYVLNTTSSGYTKASKTKDVRSIYYFKDNTLQSFETKQYMNYTWNAFGSSAQSWTVAAGTDFGYISFKDGDGYYLSNNDISSYKTCYYTTTKGDDCNWAMESVTVASANMDIQSTLGCATFVAPFKVTIPDGVKAYTTEDAHTWVKLNEITGTIPAATPVVLYCAEGYANDFEAEVTSTELAPSNGVLTGKLAPKATDVYVPKDNYVLQCNDNVTGWYKVDTENSIKIGTNRCYMTGLKAGARAFYPMAFGETTGINDIATEAATKADGKYLVNGKIVVVKAGKAYNMGGSIVK